jgi:hypothetical protein
MQIPFISLLIICGVMLPKRKNMTENKNSIFCLSPYNKGEFFHEAGKNGLDDFLDFFPEVRKRYSFIIKNPTPVINPNIMA